MGIVWPEVVPCLLGAAGAGLILLPVVRACRASWRTAAATGSALAVVMCLYFLWFFRNPERTAPSDPAAIVAAADGRIARIAEVGKNEFARICGDSGLSDRNLAKLGRLAQADSVRISIFLSLFDVHVNRAPIGGAAEFLGYFPGKRYFTFQEKSSIENQHNSIVIRNDKTCCLVKQIVGPVARRVVYWPSHDRAVELKIGERIGMMKFGSRLDMYFPRDDVAVEVKEGDAVFAGVSVIARLKKGT
ncbi:MAG: phosphatidylserine decarboxylase [Verrucomicrobiota bacterium]|nr:phosphatidylserine decarboxylase [Verrucomicrobiota bacterium]